MSVPTRPLPTAHLADETAWLEETAEALRLGRFDRVDADALAEYLDDMAGRDRREVVSRLVILLAHLLKWDFPPDRRSRSWQATILEQQRELRQLLQSRTLRNHAEATLDAAYLDAIKQAAAETGLPRGHFPADCPWSLDIVLTDRGEAGGEISFDKEQHGS